MQAFPTFAESAGHLSVPAPAVPPHAMTPTIKARRSVRFMGPPWIGLVGRHDAYTQPSRADNTKPTLGSGAELLGDRGASGTCSASGRSSRVGPRLEQHARLFS